MTQSYKLQHISFFILRITNTITNISSFPSVSIGFSSIFILFHLSSVIQAIVPPSNTFKYINEGEFGEYYNEYDATYRLLNTGSYTSFPFYLCFYNITPNAYSLGIRMGRPDSESVLRWVWEANRGNPVRENATLTFGADGNLVLADVDGKIAWQTGTANKGVVGLSLLPNGNLVLRDRRGQFVWQSFDYPTDTLLVGQSLRLTGPNKLISRVSYTDGSLGPYSMVFEPNKLSLFLKSKNSPKPLLYYTTGYERGGIVSRIVFNSSPTTAEAYAYELTYDLFVNSSNVRAGYSILSRPKYNSTLSMLRLESDGNVRIYIYQPKVDWAAWEETYTLFDRDGSHSRDERVNECNLPLTKCGSLGVCEDNQCVACPMPQGMMGWSRTCAPPRLPPCKAGKNNVDYYKVVGVEHFMNRYTEGDGPMKMAQCRDNCTKDCGWLGFFYSEESSKCLLAPELGTLTKVSNQSHVAYIKISK